MARPSQREAILDAFQDLIVEIGAGNVTLDAAVARSGVSKGGLLYHFPSKSALFVGLSDRLATSIDNAIAEAPDDPVQLIRWYLKSATDVVEGDDTLWLALFAAVRSVEEDVAATLSELFARYATPLRVLPGVLGDHVRLIGDGLYFNALIGVPPPDSDHLEQITDSLVAALTET